VLSEKWVKKRVAKILVLSNVFTIQVNNSLLLSKANSTF